MPLQVVREPLPGPSSELGDSHPEERVELAVENRLVPWVILWRCRVWILSQPDAFPASPQRIEHILPGLPYNRDFYETCFRYLEARDDAFSVGLLPLAERFARPPFSKNPFHVALARAIADRLGA